MHCYFNSTSYIPSKTARVVYQFQFKTWKKKIYNLFFLHFRLVWTGCCHFTWIITWSCLAEGYTKLLVLKLLKTKEGLKNCHKEESRGIVSVHLYYDTAVMLQKMLKNHKHTNWLLHTYSGKPQTFSQILLPTLVRAYMNSSFDLHHSIEIKEVKLLH